MGEPGDFFRPEFINRIDDIVRFRALSEDDLLVIVDIQLEGLAARLAERRVGLVVTDQAKRHLAAEGYQPEFGARPLTRLIQRTIGDPLAIALLEGRYLEGSEVVVDVAGEDGSAELVLS